MGYTVRRLYHADILVPDLEDVDRFFANVFGRQSFTLPRWANVDESTLDPTYPVDYCRFTPIAEVLIESIDPTRHLVNGIQPHPAASEPHLASLAWFMDGTEDLWREFRSRSMTTRDLSRREPQDDGPPDPGRLPPEQGDLADRAPAGPHRRSRGDHRRPAGPGRVAALSWSAGRSRRRPG